MTGAPIPEGADAVLRAEDAEERGDSVLIKASVAAGKHVGRIGEDVREGETLLRAGQVLRAQDVAMISSFGDAEVRCVRRPRVRILPTGDELVPAGTVPEGARIVNSNSVMLRPLIERDGGDVVQNEIVIDEAERVTAAILEAPEEIVMVTGGSSVGTEDHAPRVVSEHGELVVHGVAMRPASPFGFGMIGSTMVILLPGNPVSALCAYDFFAGPAIRRLGGRSMDWPNEVRHGVLGKKLVSAIGRTDYARVRFDGEQIIPIAIGGSSQLSTVTDADGVVIVPKDCEGWDEGTEVPVFLYA
jgi:molybdopterin molybdotransferase